MRLAACPSRLPDCGEARNPHYRNVVIRSHCEEGDTPAAGALTVARDSRMGRPPKYPTSANHSPTNAPENIFSLFPRLKLSFV